MNIFRLKSDLILILQVSIFLFSGILSAHAADQMNDGFTNSLGMRMVRIESGSFRMGSEGEIDYNEVAIDAVYARYRVKGEGQPPMDADPLEWDETPRHMVHITGPFYMAATPVTNAQYECFCPEHRQQRGKRGYSTDANEAVLFVN